MWNIGVTSVGYGTMATLVQVEKQVNAQRLLFRSSDSESGSKFDPQVLF